MPLDQRSLIELRDAKTSAYSVWKDRSDYGLVFHKLNVIGTGSIYDYVCANAGIAPISLFGSRTDLPASAMMYASDRGFSLWIFDGNNWIPQSEYTGTGVINGTNYTVTALDFGSEILFTGAQSRTFTLPSGLPLGWRIKVLQLGAGQVTFAADSGATVLSPAAAVQTAFAGAEVSVKVLQANTFYLTGDVA